MFGALIFVSQFLVPYVLPKRRYFCFPRRLRRLAEHPHRTLDMLIHEAGVGVGLDEAVEVGFQIAAIVEDEVGAGEALLPQPCVHLVAAWGTGAEGGSHAGRRACDR